jgi:hypothetical protein
MYRTVAPREREPAHGSAAPGRVREWDSRTMTHPRTAMSTRHGLPAQNGVGAVREPPKTDRPKNTYRLGPNRPFTRQCIVMSHTTRDAPSTYLGGAACCVFQGAEGGGLVHARAPEEVYGGGADLADEDADAQLVALVQDLGRPPGRF